MGKGEFCFKRFAIRQSRSAMKVGTDGVLLGAWVRTDGVRRILDVGAGTGVVALMVAQRNESVLVDAVEIDPESCRDAEENAAASPWADRVKVMNASLQDYAECFEAGSIAPYNLVVCNPPYFVDSLLPPSEGRAQARHTVSLTFSELATCAVGLLSPDGALAVVLPAENGAAATAQAEAAGLYVSRITYVHTVDGAPAKRVLMEFARTSTQQSEESRLTIEYAGGGYTDEYRKLTKDFYLKF